MNNELVDILRDVLEQLKLNNSLAVVNAPRFTQDDKDKAYAKARAVLDSKEVANGNALPSNIIR